MTYNQKKIDTKIAVRKIVSNLREAYEVFEINEVINDLESVIERFGVKVFYSNMQGFRTPGAISGYSRVNEFGKPEIIVNVNDSPRRQRFTMAHELGHIILHWKWLNLDNQRLDKNNKAILYRSSLNYPDELNDIEYQANEFAAELLLPTDTILSVINHDIVSLKKDIFIFNQIKLRIAEAFNVSESFAYTQLNKIINEEALSNE